MKKPSREEYTERGAALGVDETYKYVEALEGYCEQLEKAYEDVKKGLDNACNKLEGLYLCIDVLTDKESKKDKEYWKKKVMKEVFQKMNEDFENSVLKAVQKVGINVDKEELLKALIYDRGQYDEGYEDAMNEIKHPQPLKFEDLKEGMWIYDAPYEEIVRIKEIESNEWIFLECIKSKDLSNTFFQEGRFYPITIPNIGDKNG